MSTPTSTPAVTSLWRLIPLRDFESPAEPTSEAVRSRLRDLWQRLLSPPSALTDDEANVATPQLNSVPEKLLNRVVPPLWAEEGQEAVEDALRRWSSRTTSEAGIRAFVAAPFSGVAAMAIHWAKTHNYAIVKPPTIAQILENDREWMNQWRQNEAERLVLPWLERCYLRHHHGLDLIRRLLDWLLQTEKPCLIVCNSWAWAYLNQLYSVNAICPNPLTLAPFTAVELNRWFCKAIHTRPLRPFTFRQTNDGHLVLRDAAITHPAAPSSYLKYLAARSRGNPGVAWTIWRKSLNVASNENVREAAKEEAAFDAGITFWVDAWEEVKLPLMPSDIDDVDVFVLHALLLHNGLTAHFLPELLPFSAARTMQSLQKLHALHLIETTAESLHVHTAEHHTHSGQWRVSPHGYVSVRNYMRSEGFLTDML
ncbi:MAG: hypothetical protein R3C14_29665 [Caldilineaceae bacterium]